MPMSAVGGPGQAPRAPSATLGGPPFASLRRHAEPTGHQAECPTHLAPSLFEHLRSRGYEPSMAKRWPPARYTLPEGKKHYGPALMYLPLVRGLAPPGCTAWWLRAPVAMVMQWSVDVLCGATVVGASLGFAVANRRAFAVALLRDHKLQLVILAATVVQTVVAGAAIGAAAWALL